MTLWAGAFGIAVLSYRAATVVSALGYVGAAALLAPVTAGSLTHAAAEPVFVLLWFVITVLFSPLVVAATPLIVLRARGSLSFAAFSGVAFAIAVVSFAVIGESHLTNGRDWRLIIASAWFIPALVALASGVTVFVLTSLALIRWAER